MAGARNKKRGRNAALAKRTSGSTLNGDHHQQQQQQQVCEKSLCLVLTQTYAMGPESVYTVDFDDGYDYQERNFCKNCSVELFGQRDGRDRNPETTTISGFREITPSSLESKREEEEKPYGEMFASLGPRLYVLGGPLPKPKLAVERKPGEIANYFSRCVFYFDADKKEEGWKRGPDMIAARDFNGQALSLDGKIYVLWGLERGRTDVSSPPEPWGEVFDPVKNKWEPLTPLPDHVDRDKYSYVRVVTYGLEGEKKIVISNVNRDTYDSSGTYVYHVKSGTWEEFEPKSRVKALGVGNVLYWIDDGKLQAVNIKDGRKYRGKIKGSGLKGQKCRCFDCTLMKRPGPKLYHLGGKKFCFFTLHAIRGGHTKVRCFKFEVSKRLRPSPPNTHNYGHLKASVNSCVTYVLDRPLGSFTALGLLLELREGRTMAAVRSKKRGRNAALAKCTNEAEEEKMAKGIKRCGSSMNGDHQQQQQEVCEKSLCLVLTQTYAMGPDAVYAVDFDDGNDYQERNFCKNCSLKLFGQRDWRDRKPEPGTVVVSGSGFREITPSSLESKREEEKVKPYASLGSRVYALGGPLRKPKFRKPNQPVEGKPLPEEIANYFARCVFYFDADKKEEGWKRGPAMLVARDFNGQALSLDGKIYVLWGLDGVDEQGRNVVASPPEPWGEVFDPVKNKWEPLTPLPDYVDRDKCSYDPVVTYGLKGEKKIIICDYDPDPGCGVFVYHVKCGTWKEAEPKWGPPRRVKALGVGNVMYWIDDGKLWAVNMKNGMKYRGRIKGSGLKGQECGCSDCYLNKIPGPVLFHLGGKKFCFFTLRAIRGGRTKVRCFKFEVSKRLRPTPPKSDDCGYLKASVKSCVTFFLERPLGNFTAHGLVLGL